jgi:hypothetical protein
LLKKHVTLFMVLAETLEIDLHNASSAHDYFCLLQATAPLQRASRNMHAALQQAREMVPGDHQLIVARDAAGDAEREFELLYTKGGRAVQTKSSNGSFGIQTEQACGAVLSDNSALRYLRNEIRLGSGSVTRTMGLLGRYMHRARFRIDNCRNNREQTERSQKYLVCTTTQASTVEQSC